eukprot:CAMPEP_0173362498 /NCGR_PEP_ID=MMETSP1144-20121109/21837_1 /TAXON_ID=483371 /ORGANISM="non described non described, Strain CCMP2298" /LENGTH=119 /DNA_ID=CAMNT_0014312291 /DNA_START=1366 /DNA_END=1726 /DNA_ORIENTATION=-
MLGKVLASQQAELDAHHKTPLGSWSEQVLYGHSILTELQPLDWMPNAAQKTFEAVETITRGPLHPRGVKVRVALAVSMMSSQLLVGSEGMPMAAAARRSLDGFERFNVRGSISCDSLCW